MGSGAPIADLEDDARKNEHRRDQAFKDHFEKLSIWTLNALFAGFFVLASVLVFHMVLPAHQGTAGITLWIHGWLTHEQLDEIKGVLAGGIIAGLVADHFKRRMG